MTLRAKMLAERQHANVVANHKIRHVKHSDDSALDQSSRTLSNKERAKMLQAKRSGSGSGSSSGGGTGWNQRDKGAPHALSRAPEKRFPWRGAGQRVGLDPLWASMRTMGPPTTLPFVCHLAWESER